ncbi:MAG: hypothetical protein ACYCWW_14125 [Deltaproteobacteria bacterium]
MFAPLLLAWGLAQTFAPGDRVYSRASAFIRAAPRSDAPSVHPLLPGDELAVEPAPEDGLHAFPAGWLAVATPEVPSKRAAAGYLRAAEVMADEPPPVRRRGILRDAIERRLGELSDRRAAFATLKDQAIHWRTVPGGQAEGARLSQRLADYMASEVTPRALDVIDWLAELRALGDPAAPRLGQRLEELSKGFRP